MKYLIVQNQKNKQLYAVVAAENSAELDRELGQLMMRQAKLVELVSEAETLPFDSADALADHLIGVSVKPRKVMNAQDEQIQDRVKSIDNEMNQTFTFGKHKWKTIGVILHEDPGYMLWAKDNVDWFTPSDELVRIINACIKRKSSAQAVATPPNYPPIPPVQKEDDNIDYYENDLPF